MKEIIDSLKKAYDQNQYEEQVKCFIELGDSYLQEKQHHIYSNACYNFALGICQDPVKKLTFKIGNYVSIIEDKIDKIANIFLQSIGCTTKAVSFSARMKTHREMLISIHQETKKQLEENKLSVKEIYGKVGERMREIARILIEESKTILPMNFTCEYAIICLGSLARNEATPYSDLEFAVLINDETIEAKEYFRNLTKLLFILILNLGETTPRIVNIKELDWISDTNSPTPKGFSFDAQFQGGCKTPLGNIHLKLKQDEKYELIGTPKNMAKLHNEKYYKLDRHLSTVLRSVALIDGNNAELIDVYERAIVGIFEAPLESGQVLTFKQKRALDLLAESLEKFKPRMGVRKKEGHYFSSKYDFSRLPTMLIEHLAFYYDIQEKNTWERIHKLTSQVSEEQTFHLSLMFSEIQKIRLAEYIERNSQHNLTQSIGKFNRGAGVSGYSWVPEDVLFKIYKILIPFYDRVKEFNLNHTFSSYKIYDENYINARIYEQLGDYSLAITSYLKSESLPDDLETRYHLAICYYRNGDYKKAAELLNELLEKPINHEKSINCLISLIEVYRSQKTKEAYNKALECSQKIEKIMKEDEDVRSLARVEHLNNIGLLHQDMNDFKLAILILKKSLKLTEENYDYAEWLIAIELNNLALAIIGSREELDEALKYIDRAIEIDIRLHGEEHPEVTAVHLNTKANILVRKMDFKNALNIRLAAFNVVERTFGSNDYSLAMYANNLANTYMKIEDSSSLESALKFSNMAKNICIDTAPFRQIEIENDIEIAWIEYNIGCILKKQNRPQEALVIFLKKLPLFEQVPPVNFDKIYANIALTYRDIGEHVDAVEYLKKALAISEKVYGESSEHVIVILTDLAEIFWKHLGKPEEAIPYFERVLDINSEKLEVDDPTVLKISDDLKKCKKECKVIPTVKSSMITNLYDMVCKNKWRLATTTATIAATGALIYYNRRPKL